MASKYKFHNPEGIYFITYSVVEWIDVFTRPVYKDIIVESLKYAQQSKGLIIHAWVIMSNHIHLIASAEENHSLSDILRDHKKYTAKQIIKEIQENPEESRKNWMLWLFASHGNRNPNNKEYQFWQQDNHPIELDTTEMMNQRLEYLHYNPVKAGLVFEPEEYPYSSAIDYADGKGILKIVLL
jgi:REP element-mobilizing transposase RayT